MAIKRENNRWHVSIGNEWMPVYGEETAVKIDHTIGSMARALRAHLLDDVNSRRMAVKALANLEGRES